MPDGDATRLIRPTAWCIGICRMATQRVLSGLQPGAFGIAGWRRNASYPAYSLVHLVLPDGDAMRLIRPTAWCIWYCRMATQRVLSGLQIVGPVSAAPPGI
ncbi:hypothetical protein [Citrobacter koseri]|uniref:hypothetical protein n=1 Tax=Citrobacter koseri TaxID=545 RepID=UPI001C62D54D|nr:hypothetical protein [Citrobacter koseri]QYG86231.1 hypothetical protein NCK_19110 [Citrobacter koseri]